MKFKKYYKQLTAVCLVLLTFIVTILTSFDFIFSDKTKNSSVKPCNIALITYDSMDSSYKNMIEEGISHSLKTLDKTYQVFSTSDYNNSYDETIKAAVSGKASLVILPDSSFEETVYTSQTHYVNTYFMLIDGLPHNSDSSDSTINYNVIPMTYSEAEAAFLAGYAAVYDGYNTLCFICKNDDSKSLRYCYGFLQGADYAAAAEGKTDVSVSIIYETDTDWTNEIAYDTQIISTSSDEAIEQISSNSTLNNIPLICCGGNNTEAKNVIATASKNITPTVNDTIVDFFANNIKGGFSLKFDASNNGISLLFNEASFKKFDENAYKNIYKLLSMQEIKIISDTTVLPEDLGLTNITIKVNDTIN